MNLPFSPLLRPARSAGFSLVEVTMALGVLGVAIIPLIGLVPVGLKVFREAIDATVQTQIVQSIGTLAEQTDFADLGGASGNTQAVGTRIQNPSASAQDRAGAGGVRHYFNEQGVAVSQKDAIYTAQVTYWAPAPGGHANLPGNASSSNLALLWIDIYQSKGEQSPVSTHTLHVADFGKRL
jgi:uncharacterized protein (TIGR02598 family)